MTQRVGPYVLSSTLGEGNFGKVKLGIHTETLDRVAVKVVPKTKMKTTREIEVLATLKHPNIISLIDIIEEGEVIYLIMELAEGGEVFDYLLTSGRLTENKARKWFRDIVRGLDYCHSSLVVHRDLKLENLLLDQSGNVKINDFGFSRFMKPGKMMNTWCGSPVYAAPEIVQRHGYEGPKVDVWSLGIILYSLVTGFMPWALGEDSSIVNMSAFLEGRYRFPSNIPLSVEFKNLVGIMLIADFEKRASLEDVINHPWVNIGYDSPPHDNIDDFTPLGDDEVNPDIVRQMRFMGFKTETTMKQLKSAQPSQELAAYNRLLRITHESVMRMPLPRRLSVDVNRHKPAPRRHSELPRSMMQRTSTHKAIPVEWRSAPSLRTSKDAIPVAPLRTSDEEFGPNWFSRLMQQHHEREAFNRYLDESGGQLINLFLCWEEVTLYRAMTRRAYAEAELVDKITDIYDSFFSEKALYPLDLPPQVESVRRDYKNNEQLDLLATWIESVLVATPYIKARKISQNARRHSEESACAEDRRARISPKSRHSKDSPSKSTPSTIPPESSRKFSLASAPALQPHTQDGIRLIQAGPFSTDTTTRLQPSKVMHRIHKAAKRQTRYNICPAGPFIVSLESEHVMFTLEVVLLSGMPGLSGLKFSRVRGDPWSYRDEVQKFIQCLSLP